MAHGTHETEIKLAIEDARAARRLLRAGGFTIARRRVFESNTIFDTAKLSLRKSGTLVRLRRAGGVTTLTYKGRAIPGKHKSREELEVEVPDPAIITAILDRLGYRAVFRYEKYRTEYRQSRGAGMAMLDETPIGIYVELEGSPRWIDRSARQLGFQEHDYILRSYGRLYLDWCRAHKVKPTDMVW